MFLPLVFITIVTLISIYLILTKPNKHNPPGPKGLPILGNFHQITPFATHLYFTQLSKTYGPIFYLKLGSIPTIVISSPKLARLVLKTHDHIFCGRRPSTTQKKLSYNGLDMVFSPPNAYWRELRKVCMNHLLSTKRVQSFSTIRREEISWVLNEISKHVSASKAVSFNDIIMSAIVSIICRVGFGKVYRDDEKWRRSSEFHGMLNRAQLMFMTFFFGDYFPCTRWIDWLVGSQMKLDKVFTELDGFYQELIGEHLDPDRVKSDTEDIVDVLLGLGQQGGFGIQLTFDHIKAVLMNIFIAGTETTAATIVWAMAYLMKNPNTMKQAQAELRAFIKEKDATFIQEEDIQHLPYLQAIVKETLRIHPVVPLLIPHETLEKCTLEGYQIEAGTLVFVNAWAIGRDLESWKDPDLFLPERFLGSDVRDFKGQDFDLIPFGAGRRVCPGLMMGVVTIQLALANLLCWFDWEMPDGMTRDDIDMEVLPGVTILKKNPLCLYARKAVIP